MTCKYCSRPTKGDRVTCDNEDCKSERARLASARWYSRHRHEVMRKRREKNKNSRTR